MFGDELGSPYIELSVGVSENKGLIGRNRGTECDAIGSDHMINEKIRRKMFWRPGGPKKSNEKCLSHTLFRKRGDGRDVRPLASPCY
jgi:hypothetical protein